MNDQEQDIFGEVAETEVPKAQNDPNHQLYIIPEGVAEWFIAKNHFGKNPKEVKDCTASLIVRFLFLADQRRTAGGVHGFRCLYARHPAQSTHRPVSPDPRGVC